ncbi:meiotic recombination protein DMC1, partial [Trifolium pratense]
MNSTLKLKSEESSGQLQLVEREDMEDVSIDVEKLILQGIGASDVNKLRNAGIFTCNVLMNLTGIKGLSEAKFDKMREAAEKLVVSDAPLK